MDYAQVETILTAFYELAPMAAAPEAAGDVRRLVASMTDAQKILIVRAVLSAVSPALRAIVDTVAVEAVTSTANEGNQLASASISGRYVVQREKMLDYSSRSLLKALRLYRD